MGLKGATTHGQRLNLSSYLHVKVSKCLSVLFRYMYLAAGTAPFSGLPFGLPFFSMPWPHAWTCFYVGMYLALPCLMYVKVCTSYACVKQASKHRRWKKSPPPPAVGRPGHGAGFYLPFFICKANLPPSTGMKDDPVFLSTRM
ncbi:hypothetical protein V8C26DRAFT_399627 [Trichoderma gracile]